SCGFQYPHAVMENLARSNIKSVLNAFRGLDTSNQGTSPEDGDQSLLSEEKSSDATNGQVSFSSETQPRPRPQWIRYILFILGLAVYSSILVALVPRKCSDSECGKQVSLWCKLPDNSCKQCGCTN